MAVAKQPELLPTESLILDNNLSLIPRLKILLSFTRSDIFLKPIDEWQLRLSLTNLLRDSLAIAVSDGDIAVEKFKDLKKRKRVEPVASGVVYLWDLSKVERGTREETRSLNERFEEWKNYVVGKLDGVELNVEGLKLRIAAEVPAEDDFQKMKMSWEEFHAARSRGYGMRNMVQRPDTLILEGIPSRWFAEPRVSSKVSILVTHTIFSKFGKIRDLDVVGSNDLGKAAQDIGKDITSALHCKKSIIFLVQDHNCTGHSLKQEGSRLKANYRIDWDKEGYFMETNVRRRAYEKERQRETERRQLAGRTFKSEVPMPIAQFSKNDGDRLNGEKHA